MRFFVAFTIVILQVVISKSLSASVGEGISPAGSLSSKIYANIDSLNIGPSYKEVKVPKNGKGYIYFSFLGDDSLNYSTQNFTVILEKPNAEYYSSSAMFIDTGTIRLEIPVEAMADKKSMVFKFSNEIILGNTIYNLHQHPEFTASLDSMLFSRSWDFFAGANAGLSGIGGGVGFIASASAAKISISGAGGVGLKLQRDEKKNTTIDRRMEASLGISAESPSVNVVIKQMDVELGANTQAVLKGLVGHTFKFEEKSPGDEMKRMAQAGFLLETMAIGGMGISPTIGPLFNAVVTTLNESGGVNPVFEQALLKNYWGLGVEGSIGAGFGFDAGPFFSVKGAEGASNVAFNTKYATNYALTKTPSGNLPKSPIGESAELSAALGFDFSILPVGMKYDDDVELGSGNFTLFSAGAGGEIALAASVDNFANLQEISLQVKGGGDVTFKQLKESIYFNTTVNIPGQYGQLIKNTGRSIAGLYDADVNILVGAMMVAEAIESYKDTYPYLNDKPLTVTTAETKAKGTQLGLGISLDVALGIGAGISAGVSAQYFDEIEFPKKYSEVYIDGKNYLLYSSDFHEKMEAENIETILSEIILGTVPLVKNAFLNIVKTYEEEIETAQTAFEILIPGGSAISSSGNLAYEAGKWTISQFPTETKMTWQKSFSKPELRNMYYSSQVQHKSSNSNLKSISEDVESTVVVVSEALNVSFAPVNSGPVKSIAQEFTVKIPVDEQRLVRNGFSPDDKDQIKIYRYDIDSLSWIKEGGTFDGDTLSVSTAQMGVFALGVEINIQQDNKAPEIYEWGPQEGNANEYPLIYGLVRDDNFGFGVNIAASGIVLNGDTLETTYDPSANMIYYQLSENDTLNSETLTISIFASDFAGNIAQKDYTIEPATSAKKEAINQFLLLQNFPNPFSEITEIQFEVPETAYVEINIYNIAGKYIKTVFEGDVHAGSHHTAWNGTDLNGNKLSSGIYFCQLKTNKINRVKKIQMVE